MKRTSGETIPQLLVREEELFAELQGALQRARAERAKAELRSTGAGVTISLDDKPSFRFGNGQTKRAVSKLELMTPALVKTSRYNGAETIPMLVGARELRRRKAMISYKGDDWLAYYMDREWWACSLESLRNGLWI